MKVLIISTFYSYGGAEIQAKCEKKELEKKGIDTFLLTFDPQYDSNKSLERNHLNIYGNYSVFEKRCSEIFIHPKLFFIIRKFVDAFKPDAVHIHNIFFAFNTICFALKQYNLIQTIHDFTIVCIKGTMVQTDCQICVSCKYKNCFSICCKRSVNQKIKMVYRMLVRSIQGCFRNKYIKLLISPSICLANTCRKYGYKVEVINNCIALDAFAEFHKRLDKDKKIILYYGIVKENKGILKLLEYYIAGEYKNLELHIVGKVDSSIDKRMFLQMVQKSGAKYCGYMSYSEIVKKLESVYSIIIPSIWMENYPNTALEGFVSECVVCGSNRGGIPELVSDSELLFDILNEKEVRACLGRIDRMTEEERERICKVQKEQLLNRNTGEIYVQNLMKLLAS